MQPYIRDADVETVRKWKAEDSADPSYGQDDARSGPDPRIVVAIIALSVALLGAIFGVAMAVHPH